LHAVTSAVFSAFWRSIAVVFPTAHFAKVAKLALPGSNKATFTLQSPGKTTGYPHDVAPENSTGDSTQVSNRTALTL